MSINTNRAQARIKVTEDKIATIEKKISALEADFENRGMTLTRLACSRNTIVNKRRMMEDAADAAMLRMSAGAANPISYSREDYDMDAEQIKAAEAAIEVYDQEMNLWAVQIETERQRIQNDQNKNREETLALQTELVFAMHTLQKQKDALDIKEHVYPQQLGRHLRKCRKYGWTDNRLSGKTK